MRDAAAPRERPAPILGKDEAALGARGPVLGEDEVEVSLRAAKAAALGGVGPRRARRPEAADRWLPGHSLLGHA
jgi:hypothetical protein